MILVDELEHFPGAGRWCHMVSDTSVDELHAFAEKIGVWREWFQDKPGNPHYDLAPHKRRLAIAQGAKQVSGRDLIIALRKQRRQEANDDTT